MRPLQLSNITLSDLAGFIGYLGVLLAVLTPLIVKLHKICEGIKCQLRTEMLRTYYHNKDKKQIRQYEYENFIKNYKAYHALNGNSFIDEINEKIQTWEVIT